MTLNFDVAPETLETTNKARQEWVGDVPPQVLKWVTDATADRLRKRLPVKDAGERTQYDSVIRAALAQLTPDGSLEIHPRDETDADGVLVAYTFKVGGKRKTPVRKPKTADAVAE